METDLETTEKNQAFVLAHEFFQEERWNKGFTISEAARRIGIPEEEFLIFEDNPLQAPYYLLIQAMNVYKTDPAKWEACLKQINSLLQP